MALGIRGSNPIWAEFDLTGKIFDDNYYMWVLENVLPYIPATVYRDPDLNVAWTNPIQFLANGTLPVDIFFEPGVTYRLEFRLNNGVDTPSQSDPLMYEVNNYVAGSTGSTPPGQVSDATTNQITNPQFALTRFTSPLSVSGTNPASVQIGPGWFLDLTGTGNATITKVALTSTTPTPTNAPYALELNLSGWDSATLRQRFEQNGVLWANKTVSAAVTARVSGAFQPLSSVLVDSQGATLTTNILDVATVNGTFNEYTGHATLSASSNTNTPPAAYIDYKIVLPTTTDIYLTSLQLIAQDNEDLSEPTFEQDSINRQIDHTYHDAYPIMPVGTVIVRAGFATPAHFLLCNGQAVSRQTYNQLFLAMTKVDVATWTGTTTFTVPSVADYWIGMAVEGDSIPAGTTVSNIVGTTITISQNRTGTLPAVRFFSDPAGNGTTTFNVPDLRDYVIAMSGGTLFGATNNGPGKFGGSQGSTISASTNMPAHNHPGSSGTYFTGTGGGGTLPTPANAVNSVTNPVTVTVASQGGATALPIVQQTQLYKMFIRYE